MPIELAKNFDVGEGDDFVSALDHYYKERGRLLIATAMFLLSLPFVVRLLMDGTLFLSTKPSMGTFLICAIQTISIQIFARHFFFNTQAQNFRKFDRSLWPLLESLESVRSGNRPFHLHAWEEFMGAAHTRLVDIAYQIHSAVEKGVKEDDIAKTRKLLGDQYDLYLFFDLVEEGGYHPFYAEAEKKPATEKEWEATRLREFLATHLPAREAREILGVDSQEFVRIVGEGELRQYRNQNLNGGLDPYFSKDEVAELAKKRAVATTS